MQNHRFAALDGRTRHWLEVDEPDLDKNATTGPDRSPQTRPPRRARGRAFAQLGAAAGARPHGLRGSATRRLRAAPRTPQS